MKLLCAVVGNRLATIEEGSALPAVLDAHVASCLQCQAVQVRDRRMRRALADLAAQTISAPVGLVATIERVIATSRPTAVAPSTSRYESVVRSRLVKPGALAGVAAFAAGGAAVAAWRLAKRPA